jgi:hypothetical protein
MASEKEKNEAIDRLIRNVQTGRPAEIGDFFLEHIAEYGTDGIDAQAMAQLIFHRNETEE